MSLSPFNGFTFVALHLSIGSIILNLALPITISCPNQSNSSKGFPPLNHKLPLNLLVSNFEPILLDSSLSDSIDNKETEGYSVSVNPLSPTLYNSFGLGP